MVSMQWEQLPQLEHDELTAMLKQLEVGSPVEREVAQEYQSAKDTKTRRIVNWHILNIATVKQHIGERKVYNSEPGELDPAGIVPSHEVSSSGQTEEEC